MKEKKGLSRALMALGKEHGLSWKEVAAKAQIRPAVLSGYVTGKRYPHPQNYGQLASAFGLTSEELREREKAMAEQAATPQVSAPQPAAGQARAIVPAFFSQPVPDAPPERLAVLEELWNLYKMTEGRIDQIMTRR